MLRYWKVIAVVAAGLLAYRYWKTNIASKPAMMATGWGGNWTGNLPTIINRQPVVGVSSLTDVPVIGPNAFAQPFSSPGTLN